MKRTRKQAFLPVALLPPQQERPRNLVKCLDDLLIHFIDSATSCDLRLYA